MTVTGLDFAWSKPSVSAIKGAGHVFVCRYLSYDDTGKNLTKSEATAYRKAGINVVSNWEYATDAALGGYNQGVRDAREANRQHLACGGGPTDPIYFSADWDATPGQQSAINSYLDGVASVIGRARTGVYGSFYVVKRAYEAGKAKWLWQTYAWSGGQVYSKAHIYQYHNGVKVGGADTDLNRALQANYGAWGQNQEDEMTPAEIFKAVWQTDALPAPESALAKKPDNKAWWGQSYLEETYDMAEKTSKAVADLTAKVDAMKVASAPQVQVDAVTVAAELAKNTTFVNALAKAFADQYERKA